jgi:Family of unknown function (DUF5681)
MTDREEDDPPYTVGYGKPPQHTRFAKGRSGNPKGRPKGAKNFRTEIQEELDTRVPITVCGKPRRITMRKAVAKQLVTKAAAGDLKAMPPLLNEIRNIEGGYETGSADEVTCRQEDEMVMANIVKRMRETDEAPSQHCPEPEGTNSAPDPEGAGEADPS